MAGEIQGWWPKVKLGGTLWEVKSGQPSVQIATVRGDTTATGPDEVNIPNKRVMNFSFEAFRYLTINPHASPVFAGRISLTNTPITTSLKYYPLGGTDATGSGLDDTTAWIAAVFIIEEYSESFNAEQGLLTCTVRGKSSGRIYTPGET